MEITGEEKAALIRTLLSSRGWELYEKYMLGHKFEQARDQAFLDESKRHPDYKEWSMEKLTGFVMGIGFARKGLQIWLDQWDAAERAAQERKNIPEPVGNPYVEDPNPAGVAK